jgi:Cys-tRNA(Pro)/Cys-tRNA(Cys) deacylase
MAAAGTRALDLLRRAGVAHTAHAYEAPEPVGRDRDRRPAYGADAAASLDVEPARIHKTLIATVDGSLAVAVVAVADELDLKRLAEALGGRRADLADPIAAERATGYVTGGISPLGQRRNLPTVIDSRALGFATIFVSAGRRGLQVELDPADLVRLTGAQVSPIGRAR